MLKFALRNLLSRPARSLLSLLGLTVAIVGMVGLFSVAEGIDEMVSDTFGRIPGLVAMQTGAPIPLFSRIPADWGDEIEDVPGVGVVNAQIWTRVNLIDGKRIVSPPRFFFGTDIESRGQLQRGVYRDALIPDRGRFLTDEDRGTLNAVISKQIAEEVNKDVGDTIRVNGHDLTIVGIYHCGSLLLDVAIIVDIDQLRAITRFDPATVCCFYIEPAGRVDDDELAASIKSLFRGRDLDSWRPAAAIGLASPDSGNLLLKFLNLFDENAKRTDAPAIDSPKSARPNDSARKPASAGETENGEGTLATKNEATSSEQEIDEADLPIEVRSADDWAERIDEFSADLDLFLTIMTSIGVTIAVLSIVNTMLMSVTERIIEFGILKANGWSKADIMKLITCESAVLGIAGGVCGCVLGWIATQLINNQWPNHVHLFASPGLLVFSLCFSTILGVLGGLYPAIWATRMTPMDAIRRG